MRANTARRLARLEAKHNPPARVLVCLCATHNARHNLPAGAHLPDCPALEASERDRVVRVVYGEAKHDEVV
jgi:hypothetical protein